MSSWMKELSQHYEKTRNLYPEDDLMIVFDIDNTIIDMRQMIAYVLKLYDRHHDTRYFEGLRASELTINENQVGELLVELGIPEKEHDAIEKWYMDKRWTTEAILRSHRPFRGVMEVLRWFQMQPRTYVGLNTGRTQEVRVDTLRSLNSLGEQYKVRFREDLLHMFPGGDPSEVTNSKVLGIQAFQRMGFRVFAVVDNEPDNLEAIARYDKEGTILPVHADTIFDSQRSRLPDATVSGSEYDLTELISEKDLPGHIQFVWHGTNDEANLRQFIASDVNWCECDARLDEDGESIVLRNDSFQRRPRADDEELLTLEDVLPRLIRAGKSVKIDLMENDDLIGKVVKVLDRFDIKDKRLWINGDPASIGDTVFRRFSEAFPGAIVQCPLRELAPAVLNDPDAARHRLDEFSSWGVNRVSIKWGLDDLGLVISRLDEWGWDVNIYNVPDLESFLKAVLLLPRSITSDFNFPQWHYFGRGSGEGSRHHRYTQDPP